MTPLALLAAGSVPATVAAALPRLRPDAAPFAVRRVAPEATQRWQREPRLRRASPIAHFLAEACTQAVEAAPVPRERLGLVVAYFTGPSQYSRAFFQPVLERGPTAASPAYFPDTVYNASLSHVASVLGLNGPAYALVGDEAAFVSALTVARTWLTLGTADHVLVAGAEELDAIALEAYAAAGWLRRGFLPAEGAAALLVGREPDAAIQITDLVEGPTHRTPAEARAAHAAVATTFGSEPVFPPDPATTPRAFTASAGWCIQAAARQLAADSALWVPLPGHDHGSAALRLCSRSRRVNVESDNQT